jgi:cobalt-precorrin 5A hydrolase
VRLAVFAYSRQGCETARRVREALTWEECRCCAPEKYAGEEFEAIAPPCSRFTGPVFQWADAMVFVGAAGIAVRSIAPYVRDKRSDPAVLCVDELGRFVISLLSGHIGGANALAEELAEKLGAVPVVTTATDLHGKFSVDAWAAREGLAISSMGAAKEVSAAILEGPVPLCCDFPVSGDLPAGTVAGEEGKIGICVSWRDRKPFERTLLLVPRVVHVGIGCRRGVSKERIAAAVEKVLVENQVHPQAVKCAASIDLKREEEGLLAFCEERGWPAAFYSAGELTAVEGEFTASERVLRVTGVDNVCERAAMVGAERLIAGKTVCEGVTAALAVEGWTARF